MIPPDSSLWASYVEVEGIILDGFAFIPYREVADSSKFHASVS